MVGLVLTFTVKLMVQVPPTGNWKPGVNATLPVAASTTVIVNVVTAPHPTPVPEALRVRTPGSADATGQTDDATNAPHDGVNSIAVMLFAWVSFGVVFSHLIWILAGKFVWPAFTDAVGELGETPSPTPANAVVADNKRNPATARTAATQARPMRLR